MARPSAAVTSADHFIVIFISSLLSPAVLSGQSACLKVNNGSRNTELSRFSHINRASIWRSMAMIYLKLSCFRRGRFLGSKLILSIDLVQFHPGRSFLVVQRSRVERVKGDQVSAWACFDSSPHRCAVVVSKPLMCRQCVRVLRPAGTCPGNVANLLVTQFGLCLQ